jgi:hypothetical protein
MAMNMMDMIMQAAGGNTAQQAGSQFGLSPEMSQKAIGALLPAISSAMKQNTASPQGLAGLLGALQNGGHEQYLDNPQALSQNAQTDGNAILGHLFGTKEVSRAVAGRASEQTGIDTGILKQMLPMVAMMAMGGMSKQTNSNQGIQGMLAQVAMKQLMGGGNSAPKGGLGGMLGGLLGGGGRQVKQQQKAHQQGLGMLGKMLDADGDGNTMDDILGMVMNRR